MQPDDLPPNFVVERLLAPQRMVHEIVDVRLGCTFRRPGFVGDDDLVVGFGNHVVIKPGDFLVASSFEKVHVRRGTAVAAVRSSWGRLGLSTATAVGLSQGFRGHVALELVNLGDRPLVLTPGLLFASIHCQTPETTATDGRTARSWLTRDQLEMRLRGASRAAVDPLLAVESSRNECDQPQSLEPQPVRRLPAQLSASLDYRGHTALAAFLDDTPAPHVDSVRASFENACAILPGPDEIRWLNEGGVKNLLLYFDAVHILAWQGGALADDGSASLVARHRALIDAFDDRDARDPKTAIRYYDGPPLFEQDEGIRVGVPVGTDLGHLLEMGVLQGHCGQPVASRATEGIRAALDVLANASLRPVPRSDFVVLDQRLLLLPEDASYVEVLQQLVDSGVAFTERIALEGPVEFRLRMHPDAYAGFRFALAELLKTTSLKNAPRAEPLWIETSKRRAMPPAPYDGTGTTLDSWEVLSVDLIGAGIDLSHVPLTDVLEFRERHRRDLDQYARTVRACVAMVQSAPPGDRDQLLRDREDDLADAAGMLHDALRRRWRLPVARFSLAGVGAATAITSEPIAGLASLLGAMLALKPEQVPSSPFHYVAAARRAIEPPT